jgi:DNA-binding YbaB/EbfC family protein
MAGLGDLLNLMSNLGALKKKVGDVQEELAKQTAEGASADGKVVVTISGRLEVVSVKIAPGHGVDGPALEEAAKAAVGQAIDKARELQRAGMKKVFGDMPLPPGIAEMLG